MEDSEQLHLFQAGSLMILMPLLSCHKHQPICIEQHLHVPSTLQRAHQPLKL